MSRFRQSISAAVITILVVMAFPPPGSAVAEAAHKTVHNTSTSRLRKAAPSSSLEGDPDQPIISGRTIRATRSGGNESFASASRSRVNGAGNGVSVAESRSRTNRRKVVVGRANPDIAANPRKPRPYTLQDNTYKLRRP